MRQYIKKKRKLDAGEFSTDGSFPQVVASTTTTPTKKSTGKGEALIARGLI